MNVSATGQIIIPIMAMMMIISLNKKFSKRRSQIFLTLKNINPPKPLKFFLKSFFASRSEIMDPGNRNKNVRPNLSREKIEALKQLIELQRSRTLRFQACDKGCGIIVLDTPEYIRSCYAHLSSTTTNNSDGTTSHHYEEVEAEALDEAKKRDT